MNLAATEPGRAAIELNFRTPVPSKKNALKKRMGRGFNLRYRADVKDAMVSLVTEARIQWGPRKPLSNPDIDVVFFVKRRNQDKDGLWTTLQDCLVKAGVLFNDNLKWNDGTIRLLPSIVANEATGARVQLRERNGAA